MPDPQPQSGPQGSGPVPPKPAAQIPKPAPPKQAPPKVATPKGAGLDHVVVNISEPEEIIHERLDKLRNQFPQFSFAARENDTRHTIVIEDFQGGLDTVQEEQMRAVARGTA